MSSPDIISLAMDAMVAINAAIRNIRLYPAGSAMVRTSIDRVLPPLNAVLEKQGSLSFAESEKALLVYNEPISEKEIKKPQAAAFLEMMLDFGIRDVTFRRGVTSAELAALFSLLSQKPEDISAQGGLHLLVKRAALPHVMLDHKVYVALAKDQVISSAPRSEDNRLETADTGQGTVDGPLTASRTQQRASTPVLLADAVRSGIATLTQPGEGSPGSGPSASLSQLLNMLDGHADAEEKGRLEKEVASALAGLAPETLARVLANGRPGPQASSVLFEMAELLGDDAFVAVAGRLQAAPPGAEEGRGLPAYDSLMRSEKGQRLQGRIDTVALKEKQTRTARLKTGLEQIIGGDLSPLADPELSRSIPRTVSQLTAKGKPHTATAIMERMQQGLRSEDAATRAAVAAMMADTAAGLVTQGNGDAAQGIAIDLAWWIKAEAAVIPALEDVYTKLQRLAKTLLRQGAYRQANRFLEPLCRIQRGDIPKDASVRAICDMALAAIADKETLEPVMAGCWSGDGACEPEALNSMKLLCPYAAAYLLDALAEARDRSERVRILRIYPELGDYGVAALADRIVTGGAWYYLRNLISLMGKLGSAAHLDILEPLLHHPELRVQREALNTIYAIGGDSRGKVFTRYLPSADDQMKAAVAALLGALNHTPAVRSLLDLLESRAVISAKFKDPVQIKICQVLGAMGAAEAVPLLTTIATQKGVLLKTYSTSVQKAAHSALAAIKKAQTEAAAHDAPTTPPPATAAPPENDPREQVVDDLIAAGDTQAAVKLLFELIVDHAKGKNFIRAEALRDKMMAVDDMALTEIVKAAEIIEEEKSAGLGDGIADRWKGLCSILTPEETNTLFYAMETVDFPPDAVILKQHQINDRLFFINQGKVKSVYLEEAKESLLRTYEKGEVIGVDSFFEIKVCTTSLIAMTPVNAMVLPRSTLAQWRDRQPGLEPKLVDYFLKQVKEHELLKKAGLNRRRAPRMNIDGKLLIQMVDANNAPLGKPFKGEMSDLSTGGLSFFIKTSKAETARMLLGRHLKMAFAIPGKDAPMKINQSGTVLSVNYLLHTDYSVHVRFFQPLKDSEQSALGALETD